MCKANYQISVLLPHSLFLNWKLEWTTAYLYCSLWQLNSFSASPLLPTKDNSTSYHYHIIGWRLISDRYHQFIRNNLSLIASLATAHSYCAKKIIKIVLLLLLVYSPAFSFMSWRTWQLRFFLELHLGEFMMWKNTASRIQLNH